LAEGSLGSARIELTITFGKVTSTFEVPLTKNSLICDEGGLPVPMPATHTVELVGKMSQGLGLPMGTFGRRVTYCWELV